MYTLTHNNIHRLLTALLGAVSIIALDQYTKSYVKYHYTYNQPFEIIDGFYCHLMYNRGSAFSFLSLANGWQHILFIGIAIIMCFVLIRFMCQKSVSMLQLVVLSCFLGGIISNALDRIFYQYVIDFIRIGSFPIFNVADIFICLGAVMMFLMPGEKDSLSND